MGTISRVGTWHSPLSSARNSCWSCSLVGSELDLVPVCFVEDSISFILFLAWWPRNAACILVAAFSLSVFSSSSFFSPPFDSASFFESAADCLFCDDSCESTFAGLLSPFVISENLSKMLKWNVRDIIANFLKIKYIYPYDCLFYRIYTISWSLYKHYSTCMFVQMSVPRDLIIDIEKCTYAYIILFEAEFRMVVLIKLYLSFLWESVLPRYRGRILNFSI